MFLNQQETEKVEKTRYLTSNNLSYSSVNICRYLLFVFCAIVCSFKFMETIYMGFSMGNIHYVLQRTKSMFFKLYGQSSLVKVNEHLMNPPMWSNNYNNFR